MDHLIAGFSEHLRHAMRIGGDTELKTPTAEIRNVLISGLGGSGIGGSVVSQIVASEAKIPIAVNKTYHVPEYVNENTLVIISSYSGNTEETLSAFEDAEKRGAQIACITSGGHVLQKAEVRGLNHIVIPGGNPPRSMFGYSMTQLFYVLKHYDVISDAFVAEMTAAIQMIDANEEATKSEAKSLTEKIHGKTPVIYSSAPYEGVAVRFRQQINENGKMLCWHHALPEMNHNELVGWAGGHEDLAVVIFRCEDDFKRTSIRADISKEIFGNYTNNISEVHAKGESVLARSLYLVHFGDWVSFYLSELGGVDVMEVKVIDYLKSELAKV